MAPSRNLVPLLDQGATGQLPCLAAAGRGAYQAGGQPGNWPRTVAGHGPGGFYVPPVVLEQPTGFGQLG